MAKYDFGGWATKNDLRCADGKTILKNAFKGNDGEIVPLVWNHQHGEVTNVLGHALLENREEGVYAFCSFNDSDAGKSGKEAVKHGDIKSLSIFANHIQEQSKNVVHGVICEVSMVLKGANPGASIDYVMAHGDDNNASGVIIDYFEDIDLQHSDDDPEPTPEKDELEHSDGAEKKTPPADPEKKPEDDPEKKPEGEKTLAEVIDTMNEEQKNAFYATVGMVLEGQENGGDTNMKHNLFENEETTGNVLQHADEVAIINLAKSNSVGSLQTAMEIFLEQNKETLAHGIDSIETLFPDYADVRPGAPELLTTDQGWINVVLNKVHKSPITRIRTRQADVRNISALRAQGYKKGTQKKEVGNLQLIHRTTDPQTVYVKNKVDRDDIIDITDFDVVQYLYNVDRMDLNEELATAIMIGDGREVGAEGKIAEDKIRPIWTDDELYTIHADVDTVTMKATLQGTNTSANFGENYIYAEAVIQSLLYAREQYKGSGTPDFYCTPHLLNVILLARDLNGRRIYDKISDLAAALNVGSIITAEQFEGKTRVAGAKTKKLLGLMYNLADYSLGANKGGEITHFTDFDIDFNQEKSLLETRCSGANTRVKSAIALEEDVTVPAQG